MSDKGTMEDQQDSHQQEQQVHPLSLESVLRRTTSRPFRFKFSVLYITIVGVVAYLVGITSVCTTSRVFDFDSWIGVILVLLLFLEWFEENRYHRSPPIWVGLILMTIRIALIEGIVALDCNQIAVYLYPMIPFSAYFSFGPRSSVFLTLFFVVINIWRTSNGDSLWYTDPDTTSNLMALTFVMLFVPGIAHIIRLDDAHRQETERLFGELEISHRRLQAYTEQVAELAVSEERVRLARDIHDSLGHYLTVVHIQLEKALAYQERNPVEAKQAMQDAKQSTAEALKDIRRSVETLRSPELELDIRNELEKLVKAMRTPELEISLNVDGDEHDYSHLARIALFRTAQEGLTNIQKHARAKNAWLKVEFRTKSAYLVLRDDGVGFNQQVLHENSALAGSGFGLRGIEERLEIVGGNLKIQSTVGKGTTLIVEIPQQNHDNSQEGIVE